MADALLSSLVSIVLGNLNSLAFQEFGTAWGLKTELQNLASTLSTIQAVVQDAEQKQWKSEALKNWLRKLKDAAYDAEDVVDEFATEARRRRVQRDVGSQVSTFFSVRNPLVFGLKMADKLKNVREKLDAIAVEKIKFHLREGVGNVEADNIIWRQTSSLVIESEIIGRSKEEEKIINMLLTNLRDQDDVSVYAICGMGGLGKTTLAQLVFNDESVKNAFDLRNWVCVSDDFEIKRLTELIIESIEGSPCNLQGFDALQRRLQEKLSGRRFLLILDDVWNEDPEKWDGLKDALRCGAKGSAVIVTTRLENVALFMATHPIHRLGRLSDDDSWSLFKQRAFAMGRTEESVQLEIIGKAIVKKCAGVPLAIKALGSLMRLKTTESEWVSVKESEIWDLPAGGSMILPALRLSYDHLPLHLRQCFAYCSIFPKDYEMEKDQLIELWMANGFIPSRGRMDLHDMGHEIFSELVWRSFFQDVKEYRYSDITCKMHDLVHDLAQSIMRNECSMVECRTSAEVPESVRHLSVYMSSYETIPPDVDLLNSQSLRSFITVGPRNTFRTFGSRKQSKTLLPYCLKQKCLRALDLSHFTVEKLPMSIGNLKHLRYLNLSRSQIKTIPESTSCLQNLQMLKLRSCGSLRKLPKGLNRMRNLKYLDNTWCHSLTCMPAGMGQLTGLQRLGLFIVGMDSGHHIGELKGLDLRGELSIKELDNVRNLADAKCANLIGKQKLDSLNLSWRRDNRGNPPENAEEVLSGLQPHSNLKKLEIRSYQGSKFPDWMMDLLLPNLVNISLLDCGRCEHLPPLGKLPFLKSIYLLRMNALTSFGDECYGEGSISFPALESLDFEEMPSLKEWTTVNGREVFPKLGQLTVHKCPQLVELPILPSVKRLIIWESNPMLLNSVMNYTFLTSLQISCELSVLLPDGLLQNHTLLEDLRIDMRNLKSLLNQLDNLSALKSLKLESCYELESLPEGLQNLNSLERLSLSGCDSLVSFPVNRLHGLSSLRWLNIQSCKKLASLSEGMQYLTALETLLIEDCPELKSLPDGMHNLKSLETLDIHRCESLVSFPVNGLHGLSSLRSLSIQICKKLASLSEGLQYLTALEDLTINDCPELKSLPDGMQHLTTLRRLTIVGCPNLERRYKTEIGEDWPKIAHIPNIQIYP